MYSRRIQTGSGFSFVPSVGDEPESCFDHDALFAVGNRHSAADFIEFSSSLD
jgi:hypothetical protein